MTLTRGLFQDNTASGDGGGIAARGGRVAVSGSIFHGNKAGGRGSAAMVVGGNEPALVANSLIVRNEAAQPDGGAVAAVRTVLKNVTIDSNQGGGLAHLSAVAAMAAADRDLELHRRAQRTDQLRRSVRRVRRPVGQPAVPGRRGVRGNRGGRAAARSDVRAAARQPGARRGR